jgi:3-phosphoshikimate 1-carboxyvinyltransferase
LPTIQTIAPLQRFDATLTPPPSKSLTNRALLLAALGRGRSIVRRPLMADDTRVMLDALDRLGFAMRLDEDPSNPDAARVTITGTQGLMPVPHARLDLGNAGTAMRPLAAACCLGPGAAHGPGDYVLDGVARMRQRPIGQLVQALRQIGGDVQYLGETDFPPLRIAGRGLRGGVVEMPPTLSSQFISALLMVGPYTRQGLELRFTGPVTSRPYVEMTLSIMARFGATVAVDEAFTSVKVAPGSYEGQDYTVEPDASNASYFLAAAAVIPGSKCTITGLGKRSVQGDVGFADVLAQMGAGLVFGDDFITVMAPSEGEKPRAVDVDLNRMPDMAQTLAVVALFAQGTTVIRNVGNLRVKETDRLLALQTELTKLGAAVSIDGDDLRITPPADGKLRSAGIDTYDDHRMAMSFAVAALAGNGPDTQIVIHDPRCVEKTFPDFFDVLDRLRTATP